MSFFLTQEQVKNKTKTVTRRLGWKNIMPGDFVQPVVKGQGLKKGEKIERIGTPIRIESISVQRLHQITQKDVVLEGFPEMNTEQFIEMFCKANKCDRNTSVNRIEFSYGEGF